MASIKWLMYNNLCGEREREREQTFIKLFNKGGKIEIQWMRSLVCSQEFLFQN